MRRCCAVCRLISCHAMFARAASFGKSADVAPTRRKRRIDPISDMAALTPWAAGGPARRRNGEEIASAVAPGMARVCRRSASRLCSTKKFRAPTAVFAGVVLPESNTHIHPLTRAPKRLFTGSIGARLRRRLQFRKTSVLHIPVDMIGLCRIPGSGRSTTEIVGNVLTRTPDTHTG